MGAFSRINTTLQEPALHDTWQQEVDFSLAEEVIKTKIIDLFCNLDFTKEPSDFNGCTLEQLCYMYEILEQYRSKLENDGLNQLLIDREDISGEPKNEITKADMISFICQYDTSITPEILNPKTIEGIKESYKKIKKEIQKRENKNFNQSGLSRKRKRRRRVCEYERKDTEE